MAYKSDRHSCESRETALLFIHFFQNGQSKMVTTSPKAAAANNCQTTGFTGNKVTGRRSLYKVQNTW